MLQTDILWDEEGILWFGRKGEAEFGRRNFMDLLSMITSEPLFTVRHGRHDLGFVHQLSFAAGAPGTPGRGARTTLLLAGRSWQVNHLDWQRKVTYVEPAREPGRSRWIGSGQTMSFEMAQAIRRILAADDISDRRSRRAQQQLGLLRQEAFWLHEGCTTVLSNDDSATWWTFAGDRANAAIAAALGRQLGRHVDHDSTSITFGLKTLTGELTTVIETIRSQDASQLTVPVSDEALKEPKFSSCLPADTVSRVLQARLADLPALRNALAEKVRYVG